MTVKPSAVDAPRCSVFTPKGLPAMGQSSAYQHIDPEAIHWWLQAYPNHTSRYGDLISPDGKFAREAREEEAYEASYNGGYAKIRGIPHRVDDAWAAWKLADVQFENENY